MVKTININMAETIGNLGDIYEEYDTDDLHKVEIETKPIISITNFKHMFFNSSSEVLAIISKRIILKTSL